jgi:hypothetical protein
MQNSRVAAWLIDGLQRWAPVIEWTGGRGWSTAGKRCPFCCGELPVGVQFAVPEDFIGIFDPHHSHHSSHSHVSHSIANLVVKTGIEPQEQSAGTSSSAGHTRQQQSVKHTRFQLHPSDTPRSADRPHRRRVIPSS